MAESGMMKRVGEFGLIVVGVLVAIALESWWSGVGERADEALYLEALQEELASNVAGVEQSLTNRATADSSLTVAVRLLDQELYADSAAAFILGLINASVYESVPLVNDAVFEDLNATGSFRLIRDDELRRRIRFEYGRLSKNWTRLARAQASLGRDLGALVARHVPGGILQRPAPLDVLLEPGDLDLAPIAESIANDPDLRSEMNLTHYALAAERGYLNEANGILEEYHAALASVIESSR